MIYGYLSIWLCAHVWRLLPAHESGGPGCLAGTLDLEVVSLSPTFKYRDDLKIF